ncbi:unnamed protein product [Microthlaspi erraticum]|uniref:Uncharacterized protein n=1 Tax=Microthlaspi erraticum TaxID=1685480 RepID=A0A6D2JTD2_9BRAS|nr:unnamed protein product [Microthlaspi erraticum]
MRLSMTSTSRAPCHTPQRRSVALRLLHAGGHSCTAFYLKTWFQEGFENFWNQCPWEDDLKRTVCRLKSPAEAFVNMKNQYGGTGNH